VLYKLSASNNRRNGEGKRHKREPVRAVNDKLLKPIAPRGAKATQMRKSPRTEIHSILSQKWLPARKHLDLIRRSEKKSRTPLLKDEPDPLIAAMQEGASLFMNPNETYKFRLASAGTILSTSGLTQLTYITWDPSSLTEYSTYLTGLFNTVRIVHAKVTLLGSGGAGGTSDVAYAISSDLGFSSTAPTSIATVVDNPNSMLISATGYGKNEWTMSVHVPSDYLYAPIASPVSLSGTGCYGQFSIASSGNESASQTLWTYLFEGVYEFRSRS